VLLPLLRRRIETIACTVRIIVVRSIPLLIKRKRVECLLASKGVPSAGAAGRALGTLVAAVAEVGAAAA
jgi:hypothetical protein